MPTGPLPRSAARAFHQGLDAALLAGDIALAVHSAGHAHHLPDGIVIAGYLAREDVRDAFVAPRRGLASAARHLAQDRLAAPPSGFGGCAPMSW
jgi:porphobilinogen deaminase